MGVSEGVWTMGKVKKAKKPGQGAQTAAGKPRKKPGQSSPSNQGGDGDTQQGQAAAAEKEEAPRFTRPAVFSKPQDLAVLFPGFREVEIDAEIVRLRMLTESVEHGRGKGIVRNFTFRKFKEQPRGVLFVSTPRGMAGGSFEPTDRLLAPGEQVQISFTMDVEGADRPIYFMAKGYFLRKSFYVAEDPQNPGKPWTGAREEATEKFSKDVVVRGEDILELRVDTVTSFPSGPGSLRRDVLDRYLSQARLYVLPGGGGWAQKSTQGNFFDGIQDPLDKYLEREGVKQVERVSLDEFGNLGDVSVMVEGRLLADVDHEVARPSVVKKPNDYLREINASLGFLLRFKMDYDVKEVLMRNVPNKAGAEDDVYLPLVLERVSDAKERFRVTFRLFPRDLVESPSRKSADRGLKFMPPYALHPGAENHNAYSKLLIALSQRFREDEKPEDEKLKSEKLQASVQKRISEQKGKFVDEKVKSAFQGRVAAKKRKEEEG